MNPKQLEAQAKALAPILRGYVDSAVTKALNEFLGKSEEQLKALSEGIEERLKAIPSVDDILQQIPCPEPGEKGEKGDPGEHGQSVDVEDLKPVLEEMVKEHVSAVELPEPKEGERGEKGDPGEKGEPGESVSLDDLKPVIAQLVKEEVETIEVVVPEVKDGEPGEKGADGKDGENGRDALEIEILPEIDQDKSYPRGSYAKHNGGLWRAFEKTHGMRGWEVIVNGYPEVDIQIEDERTVKITTVNSEGEEITRAVDIPVLIYRGVWKEGKIYEKGDTVTWGGSLWHCDALGVDEKPGLKDSRWTLCAKKGRDGK